MLGEFPIYPFTCIFDAGAARQDYIAGIEVATMAASIGLNSKGINSDVGSNRTRIHGI